MRDLGSGPHLHSASDSRIATQPLVISRLHQLSSRFKCTSYAKRIWMMQGI
ncbi:hypothetical protein HanIR_Chr06g0275881 [Helianthus annuus]|nr:hypothetical protein HanIR_Chr06g0275881 [Helianthus annuus]